MEFYTTGKKYSVTYRLPLVWRVIDSFDRVENEGSFSVLFVEDGKGVIRLNGVRHVLFAPSFLLLSESDAISADGEIADLRCRQLRFLPGLLNARFTLETIRDETNFGDLDKLDLFLLQTFFDSGARGRRIPTSYLASFKGFFDGVCSALEDQIDDLWPCRSKATFIELLTLARQIREMSTRSEAPAVIGPEAPSKEILEIMYYLQAHYGSRIRISDLAGRFGLNRTTMHYRFKAFTGLSVGEYLARTRISMAATMLRDTSLTASEIAWKVGFQNYANFYSSFRRHCGSDPVRYRRDISVMKTKCPC